RIPSISTTTKIFNDLNSQIDKNRSAFSNYNMVRMREAIRYFSSKKLELFIKIPFLLHINSPQHPGFCDSTTTCHGIWNFMKSGFYKVAVNTKSFPKSILETAETDQCAIEGFYHIGSLGTFTQSEKSDFDYWIIIDKKQFSKTRYENLEKKLDDILKYCREKYNQQVTFFIMDQNDIKNDCYAPFQGEETISAPKIFLKEEFYRTFLMIAGRLPAWTILPDLQDLQFKADLSKDGILTQILPMNKDLINLGQITEIPYSDIVKGLLWHICKASEDPVKALIKATMIFSYGLNKSSHLDLLCEKIKQGYSKAGIDDYAVDPYKILFDRVLKFHEQNDPKGIHLIKNAIFFRLCHYPDIRLPSKDTPKRELLDKYIRDWTLNKNQVTKLLSFSNWPEEEKLLLEKTLIQRLAQMYNHAINNVSNANDFFNTKIEKKNWLILKNKTRKKLNKIAIKIPECSTYLKQKNFLILQIIKTKKKWTLNALTKNKEKINKLYRDDNLLGVLGWILENQLYYRQQASLNLNADLKLFKSVEIPIDTDKLYMAMQPLKPLSDDSYEQNASWSKMMILLLYQDNNIYKAEFLISNTWGELFLETIEFSNKKNIEEKCNKIAKHIQKYSDQKLRFFIYQLSNTFDPNIVYIIKKTYNDLNCEISKETIQKQKPYLDKL
ncbi:class I adenylate cyclase, partial [bacterium]|nr:class I adenylate cyclase [bacterium]